VATTLDCEVLRDLFGSEEVRRVFDSRALVQGWLDAECALAEAQAEVGVIPEAAAATIKLEADASRYDLDALRAGIAESQHPLVPLIRALVDRCGEDGKYVHWGATTQDIIDTGLVLQVRRALNPIGQDLRRARASAAALSWRYADAPIAGRTHGQHAVPVTFGLKAAIWADELSRCAARLDDAAAGVLTGQLGGAAGTLAALGDAAAAVRSTFCRRLGLAESVIPWHTSRDRLRDLGHALAEIASAGERIAAEVVALQATEVGELAEPLGDGGVGSSTMPQKRNPMVSEYIVATARLVRGATSVLVGAPVHLHERDMGAWAAEWIALPQALILTGGLLEKLAFVLDGLVVDTERMLENLNLTRGQIMAEAVMMALAPSLGHERAHAVVAAASRRATDEQRDFSSVLRDDPDVGANLRVPLEELLEPGRYLGLAGNALTRPGADPASTEAAVGT
jgi:adenylosuccinate lyase/3-carboxy-cis,cis-muconate cycloisomerase